MAAALVQAVVGLPESPFPPLAVSAWGSGSCTSCSPRR